MTVKADILSASDESEEEEEIEMEDDTPKEKWDCESILSKKTCIKIVIHS